MNSSPQVHCSDLPDRIDPVSAAFPSTVSSAAGAFTFRSVPAGTYVVCARPASTAYTDSCLWGFPRVTAEGPAAPGASSILIPLKKTSCFEGSLERFRRVLASPADGVPLPGAPDIAGEQRGLGQ